MPICSDENCTSCPHHQIFNCLEKKLNEEANAALEKLKNVCDIADASGMTFLHYSVKYKNAEITQYLIDQGCDVNAQDVSGVSPLMLSIKNQDVPITEILIKNNADIYAIDSAGVSTFEIAMEGIQNDVLQMIVDKVSRDFLNNKEMVTKFLLNANDLTKFVIIVFGSEVLIKFVIEHGYPIDFVEPKTSQSALHYAVRFSRLESVKILLKQGANVDLLDNSGCSVLRSYGLRFEDVDENSEVLKILLNRSTRLSVFDENTLSDVECLLMLQKKKTIKALFQSGIDVNACLNQNRSLMFFFIWNINADVLDIFTELDIKFDGKQERNEGDTYLMMAARRRSPEFVQFLLEHDADVNYSSFAGTALSNAMIGSPNILGRRPDPEDEPKVIEMLLQYGADAQTAIEENNRLLIDTLFNRYQDKAYTKTIVADLAILGATEPPILTKVTRQKIELGPLKDYFEICTQQLEEMKQFELDESMTLLKLLTKREPKIQNFQKHKLVTYARKPEVKVALNSAMEILSRFDPYYSKILDKRITTILNEVTLQEKVCQAIQALTGLSADVFHIIVHKIMDYLDRQNLHNLCDNIHLMI